MVGECFAVGEHDQGEVLLRYLQVDGRKSGTPMSVVPDQLQSVVVRDEPTEPVRKALTAVGDERRPGPLLCLFLQEHVLVDRGVELRQIHDTREQARRGTEEILPWEGSGD